MLKTRNKPYTNTLAKIKKMKIIKSIIIFVFIIIFSSCASSFKTINPENQEFSHRIETKALTVEYNPNILKHSKNTRFQKKANKKNISFIVGKFTNNSSDTLNLGENVIFNIEKKSINESYSKLKQRPWTYFLALISAGFTISSQGNSGYLGINPLALIYSIPNSIIATIANKKMKKEFKKYDLKNITVPPNESKYGLISYNNKNSESLNIEMINGLKIDSKNYSSKYKSFIIENCIEYDESKYKSYEEYRNNLVLCLNKSKLVSTVSTFENKYKNGKTKILGINAKHKLGRNSNYLYKVGTWAFYSKDGELEKYIEYDVNGKEVKK
tara:strand:- start:60 stop:1040 length:981 start_codon:yes stop_codon:yes gene_type:complete